MRAARILPAALAAAAAASLSSALPTLPVYRGSPWPSNATARAQATLAALTQAQKFALLAGSLGDYVGYIGPTPNASLPSLNLEDGPQGVADDTLFVTAWPSAMTVAMTWNLSAVYAFARGMAEEQHGKGTNIHLAPAMNIVRVSVNGRAWEYLSEDPYLASRVAEQEVAGIQSLNLCATAKHFVLKRV